MLELAHLQSNQKGAIIMGWPRSKEECRLYREREGSYVMVLVENGRSGAGNWDAIANVYSSSNPSLCGTSVSDGYLQQWGMKRVEWSILPEEWKQAFLHYIRDWDTTPEAIRGFWKIKPKVKIGQRGYTYDGTNSAH